MQQTHGNRAVQRLLQRRVASPETHLQRQSYLPSAPVTSQPAPSPPVASLPATGSPSTAPPATNPPTTAPPTNPPAEGAPPETAPPADATPITVTFGSNADESTVSATALGILKDVLRAANLSSAMISSTARDAAEQARVMYNNLVGTGAGQGVEAQKALYGSAGDQVIDVFVAQKAAGKTADEIKEAMRAKIVELGPTSVSRHASDPAVLIVFDVSPNSIGDSEANESFVTAARAESRISHFIAYPDDPGHHFEIKP
jgi:hypothetical protein